MHIFQFVRKTSGFVVRYASCAHTIQPIFQIDGFCLEDVLWLFRHTHTTSHTHIYKKRREAKATEHTLYYVLCIMYISSCFFRSFFLSFILSSFFLAACWTNPSIRVWACYPKHSKQTVVVIEIFCVQHRFQKRHRLSFSARRAWIAVSTFKKLKTM